MKSANFFQYLNLNLVVSGVVQTLRLVGGNWLHNQQGTIQYPKTWVGDYQRMKKTKKQRNKKKSSRNFNYCSTSSLRRN